MTSQTAGRLDAANFDFCRSCVSDITCEVTGTFSIRYGRHGYQCTLPVIPCKDVTDVISIVDF